MKKNRIGHLVVLGLVAVAATAQNPNVGDLWEPWGAFSDFSYASSPANQTITAANRQQNYTQVGELTDKDTWRYTVSPYPTQVFPSPFTNIELDIESGSLVSINNAYNGETGKRTRTWVLFPRQDVESVMSYQDTFTYTDTSPNTHPYNRLRDVDGQQSTNTAQYL